jgi:DNA-binding NtrC family response regulator
VELAVKAVKMGAFDFVLKPWDNNKLIATLQAAMKLRKSQIENINLKKKTTVLTQELKKTHQAIIGQSEAMKQVMEMVKKVAVTDANIFITGENGTGKELIAKEIHYHSKRRNELMLTVDMGSISETLFESELFGHTKGSFTDAKEERTGKFEAASKGTIFLDEIGNLSLSMQAKILSVLQNRSVTKLGSNTPIDIDIRLISATNKNLNEMVKDGHFREDLLYRINTITIELPPLREREYDIILLAEYYLRIFADKYGKQGLKIDQKASKKLLDYGWPGNIRELKHSIEKAVILADSKTLTESSFNLINELSEENLSLHNSTIEEMEKVMIQTSLKNENGNLSNVAKKLGITRQTLYNKLKKYDL